MRPDTCAATVPGAEFGLMVIDRSAGGSDKLVLIVDSGVTLP